MSLFASFLMGATVGACVGATALARWWSAKMRNPEYAKQALAELHKAAHPHWLQVSETDTTPVCPCCGWSPKR